MNKVIWYKEMFSTKEIPLKLPGTLTAIVYGLRIEQYEDKSTCWKIINEI